MQRCCNDGESPSSSNEEATTQEPETTPQAEEPTTKQASGMLIAHKTTCKYSLGEKSQSIQLQRNFLFFLGQVVVVGGRDSRKETVTK